MLFPRRSLTLIVLLACGLGASVALSPKVALSATLDEVARLFRTGRYAQARALSPAEVRSGRPGEAALWGLQLADEPRLALRLARELMADDGAPLAVRSRAALDAAAVALGQDRPAVALEFLQPLLADDRDRALVPREVCLLAGTAARALRMHAEARRYLELVPAGDPAYGAAQYQLGRLALDTGEFKRAADTFQNAAAVAGGGDLLADAGRWQALRRLGRAAEAQSILQKVLSQGPSSLAAMEIRSALHREGGQPGGPLPPDTPAAGKATLPTTTLPTTELMLELARFDDRGAALVFVGQWRGVVSGLAVVEAGDGYAVVTGRFATEDEAQQAADDLRDTHDLRAQVVEREGR